MSKVSVITLGLFIEQLEAIALQCSGGTVVKFADETLLNPEGYCSWRGYYDQLCLIPNNSYPVGLEMFINMTKSCDGKMFEGWKGGEYYMNLETLMWCAPEGYGTTRGIVGARLENNEVVIDTQHFEHKSTNIDESNWEWKWLAIGELNKSPY